jgi:asparagine synthase (glutamine-hydrolysing)
MTQVMHHRGPDDEGYMAVSANGQMKHFIGEETPVDVRSRFADHKLITAALDHPSLLAIGHRRLSIMDVSPAGHQPMSDPTGRYWIVFNGEIYNFKDLRLELKTLGYRFRTSSDTEVILAAYSQFQEGCLTRLNGDFALAIWDHRHRSLFCARDRMGIKPLYYLRDDCRFIFASDIKTLIASGLYRPEPDPQGLYLAMAFGIAPRPITAFRGVRALEQAHWMRLHADGRLEKQRYWHIPLGTQQRNMSEADAVSLLQEQLQRAVSRRLIADVPVGTFMSGGVDSTTISAIAARQHPGIKAFTLGYRDDAPELDEVAEAAATARLHPMQHIVKRVAADQSLCNLSQWIAGYEEPFYSLAANDIISRLVKENNVTVIVNGLGGDELFAGYGWYRYHRLPRWPWLGPFSRRASRFPSRKLRTALMLLAAKTPDRLHTLLFAQASDQELGDLLTPSFRPGFDTPDMLHELYARDLEFDDCVEAMSYMDLMNYIGNHHVHRVDQFTMAHSIEGRFPFLDHELIEAAFSIPTRLKMCGEEQKYVLRRVAEHQIAPACLMMKKKGFGLPLEQWMRGPLKPLVERSLDRLRGREEVNAETVTAWHVAYEQGHLRPSRIWHLVALELWFEHFIDPGLRPTTPARLLESSLAPNR